MSEAEIPRPAVILLSGGLDSMVSAALARERGHSLHALTIDYGQRHIRELQSARAIAEKLGVERHVELPLDLRQFGGSALTADIDVPKDGVAETIPVTYVPARNLVFLALTTAFAETSASRASVCRSAEFIHTASDHQGTSSEVLFYNWHLQDQDNKAFSPILFIVYWDE